jgi:hypothetical protein
MIRRIAVAILTWLALTSAATPQGGELPANTLWGNPGAGRDYGSPITPGGDLTFGGSNLTFNAVNGNVGTFGSATQCVTFTVNAKGLITGASQVACTAIISTEPGSLINCSLVVSVSGNNLTVALKTQAGADPSSGSPCIISFRDLGQAPGTYTPVNVTAATSFTANSGSTFASTNVVPFRLWITAINENGTVKIGVSNQSTSSTTAAQVLPIDEGSVFTGSTTACNACGTATALGTIYTTTASTNRPVRILGYATWESGLATAGTWTAGPTITQLMGPGVKKPGDVIQRRMASTTTGSGVITSATYTAALSTSITPISAANMVSASTAGNLFIASSLSNGGFGLFRGTCAGTNLVASPLRDSSVTLGFEMSSALMWLDGPRVSVSQTYTACVRGDGTNGASYGSDAQGGAGNAAMILEEIMGANDNERFGLQPLPIAS